MSMSDGWADYASELQERIARDGVDSFMDWSVTNKTMVRGFSADVMIEKQHVMAGFLQVRESDLPTGTSVQQYHALLMARNFGIELGAIRHVVEFGAGIGEMVYAAKKVMPNLISHTIFDIEPVCTIQRYRFERDSMQHAKTFSVMSDFTKHVSTTTSGANPKEILFISICVISEAPVQTRDSLLRTPLGASLMQNSILRVQPVWDMVDNLAYFIGLAKVGEAIKVSPCVFSGHVYMVRAL